MNIPLDSLKYTPPTKIRPDWLDKLRTGPEEYNWSEEEIAQFKAALAEMFGWDNE